MRDGSGHILVYLLLSYRDDKVKGTYQAAETEKGNLSKTPDLCKSNSKNSMMIVTVM